MAVAAGLSGHDGPLAALPKEIVALLDTQAVVKRIRNNQVSTAIRTQSAHATTFKQLRGIVNPQLHPKGKLQQLVARSTSGASKNLVRESLIKGGSGGWRRFSACHLPPSGRTPMPRGLARRRMRRPGPRRGLRRALWHARNLPRLPPSAMDGGKAPGRFH